MTRQEFAERIGVSQNLSIDDSHAKSWIAGAHKGASPSPTSYWREEGSE